MLLRITYMSSIQSHLSIPASFPFSLCRTHGECVLFVNGWLRLSLSLRVVAPFSYTSLRPYHSLLLISPLEDIVAAVTPGSPRDFLTFLTSLSISSTFLDMEASLGLPLQRIFVLASHVIGHGHARPVCLLGPNTVIAATPAPQGYVHARTH